MTVKNVLFISTRNNCRSVMAQAYLNAFGSGCFNSDSAGFVPQDPDSFTEKVMAEENIDVTRHIPRSVFDAKNSGKFYNYVILTCARETVIDIPSFPGSEKHIKWEIDGAFYSGLNPSQKLNITRKIRDEIRAKVIEFVNLYK